MRIGVVGAGSWGTAIANLLATNSHDVRIWAFESEVVASINAERVNSLFLPDSPLDERLTAHGEIGEVVKGTDLLVTASPSHAVRVVGEQMAQALGNERPPVVSISKGLEKKTHNVMTSVLEEAIPGVVASALSGPSFAKDVYQAMPTAVVVGASDPLAAERVQQAFSSTFFRVYTSQDVMGVQLGGALKNVIAIAAGILDGLGLGHNTRAALITRGLAEMTRLGEALGASPLTFAGLAGMGDLILTATGDLSRNRTLGVLLGQGQSLEEAQAGKRTVAEGVNTALAAVELGEQTGIEMPIAAEVEQILFEGKTPQQAIKDLMERELKAEIWR